MLNGQTNQELDELLNRVKYDRCRTSFKTLFDHFYPKVHYFFQKNIKGEKCSDLAQETLLSVWHKASSFDSTKGSCNTWVFTIARNLQYDHFRTNSRDVLSIASEDIYNTIEDTDLQVDERLLPDEILLKINILPEEQKDAVKAMFFEGYTHGEYAVLKKIPLGTVKSRIRLALAHLKKGMEGL